MSDLSVNEQRRIIYALESIAQSLRVIADK